MKRFGIWMTLGLLLLSVAIATTAHDRTAVRTIKVAGLSRTYYLHVPLKLPNDEAVPLVLMFHGGGGNAAYAEYESKFSVLADREGFLVAYPQGYKKSWNDGRESSAIAAQRDQVDDIRFVAALIDDVAKDAKVDAKQVYATGISNGAIFSHYLAAKLSTRIAAIAPVAGGIALPLSEDFSSEQPVSVLIIHGTEDPLVPFQGGAIILPWGRKRGAIISTNSAVEKWVALDGTQRNARAEVLADTDPTDGCQANPAALTPKRSLRPPD
jgi:polyhydroxybutyrate depolymerase